MNAPSARSAPCAPSAPFVPSACTAPPPLPAQRGVPLSGRTTFGVGGPAAKLVDVTEVAHLREVLRVAAHDGEPVLVMGGGSNLLVCDAGFAGTVVHVAIKGRVVERLGGAVWRVTLGAGEDWANFVQECVSEGWSGVECLAGIPGLAGGTPVQNVGAYGEEVAQTIESVGVWDCLDRRARRLPAAACRFRYRSSVFKRNQRYVVTDVSFRLARSRVSQPLSYAELAAALGCALGAEVPLAEVSEAVLVLRRGKGMLLDPDDPDTRSAGSFFTNPVMGPGQLARLRQRAPGVPAFVAAPLAKVPAAWLVEHAGFHRGYGLGSAAISSKHALAITARTGATADDVLLLARAVRDGVQRRFGVVLQPEPALVGLHL
ncbi:MAG TPA: UDP-N-acetylmuramate dehydrogenase [Acidimicrobiales bacterium]|nr:UDP-N-acetylmuramate dehydrogenase [Acidimicrobiales bacterium]